MEHEIIPRTVRRRVRYGARQLDHFQPGWAFRVNPAKLSIGSEERCIAGQLAGSYTSGYERLGISKDAIGTGMFISGPIDDRKTIHTYNQLTAAWRQEIARRVRSVSRFERILQILRRPFTPKLLAA